MPDESKLYEITFFLSPKIENPDEVVDSIRKQIEDKKGIIVSNSRPDKRRTAYLIDKEREGIFGCIRFMIRPGEIKNLNENISRKTEVMRFFIVKGEEANPEPWRGRETRIRRPQEQKAQDIESIDKKLEEILGS